MRKMTFSDGTWLESAEEVAASGITPADDSALCFGVGKYHDYIEDFEHPFQNYKRANDLLKPIAEPFDRDAYQRFVDIMIMCICWESLPAWWRLSFDEANLRGRTAFGHVADEQIYLFASVGERHRGTGVLEPRRARIRSRHKGGTDW